MSTLELPPLSLYVHIPWCLKKCPYCDFNSHSLTGVLPESLYITQLEKDVFLEIPKVQNRRLESIFIGGGTPSLISPEGYRKFLSYVEELIPFSDDMEITLEVNPGACEYGALSAYKDVGINRFSVGVQSFQDDKLKKLGRVHNGQEATNTLKILQQVEEKQFNIDLMYGLPGQTEEEVVFDLQSAIAMKPDHISWYQLTIEPNTEFYSKPPVLPVDDDIWSMQERGRQLLESVGYIRYEISAYALSDRHSRHNLNYWQFGDYIGVGAGAHGKWTERVSGKIFRNKKTRMPKKYLQVDSNFEVCQHQLLAEDLPIEFLMNALRLIDGVDECYYFDRTGMCLENLKIKRDKAISNGLLKPGFRLQATQRGLLFLNDLLEYFMPSCGIGYGK